MRVIAQDALELGERGVEVASLTQQGRRARSASCSLASSSSSGTRSSTARAAKAAVSRSPIRVASCCTRIITSRRMGATFAASCACASASVSLAEMLRDDRAAQRDLVVTEHGLARAEVAIDQLRGRVVAEPEREPTARVEGPDVAGILDEREVVGARGLIEGAELLGEARDLEPRDRAELSGLRATRAHRGDLAERGQIARCAVHVREHAERGRVPRLGAPQLGRELVRGLEIAGHLGAIEPRREVELAALRLGRGRPAARGRLEQPGAIGGARRDRGVLVELRGVCKTADRLVAPRERQLRGRDRSDRRRAPARS